MDLTPGLRRVPAADPAEVGDDAGLVARIRAEIAATGPMTFARFMELALYDPEGGYYRSGVSGPGRSGDFLTAPETHPIFGETLANQFAEIWERLDRPDPFVIQEFGAGNGALAEAILRGLERNAQEVLGAVRCLPMEVDPRRVEAVRQRLANAGFADAIRPPADGAFSGIALANEVLDALPVHRIGRRDGRLLERFVGLTDGGAFADAWHEPSTPAIADRLTAEGIELTEGQSAEVCLALEPWIASAVSRLGRGLLLLFDYGASAAELYDPLRRPDGTLRSFVRHRLHADVYANVGRQDLTAHVDLAAVDAAARTTGLRPIGDTSQGEFLVGNGLETRLREVQADPTTTLESYLELRSALVRLIDPAGMGGFRVVGYGRAWPDGPPLAGFAYSRPGR
jgi:SAM-dependent MidA family methyltransferase